MPLSAPGIGSGLDVNSIISQLLEVESKPLAILDSKEITIQTKLSNLGTIKSSIDSLQTATTALKSAGSSSFMSTKSSDSTAVTASALSSASPATYNIKVTQLAQAQSITATGQTSKTTAIGGGAATTLTINFGTISGGTYDSNTGKYTGSTFTANTNKSTVTVDISTNNTLEGIRDAINANTSNVSANIINDGSGTPYRLVLTSKDTGASNSLKVDVSGDATLTSLLAYDPAGTQNLSQIQTGQSAQFTLNNIASVSDTNTVTSAVVGATFNLLKETSSAVTVTIAKDNSDVQKSLEGFITAYNDLNGLIKDATGYKAILQGDGGLRTLSTQLSNGISAAQFNGTNYQTLFDLGVTMKEDGSLSLNTTKLQTALTADSAKVKTLVGNYGTRLNTIASAATGNSGLITEEIDSFNEDIDKINEQRNKISKYIEETELTLRLQYAQLDSLLSDLNQTSTFLTQQFANIQSLTNGGNK